MYLIDHGTEIGNPFSDGTDGKTVKTLSKK
jgi:hypothetical protein